MTLDVIVSSDGSVEWKDEDEFEQIQELGLITAEQAHRVRAEGEALIDRFQRRKPPFDGSWDKWRPEPKWPIPDLPLGWQILA